MIRHTVVFRLKFAHGSVEEKAFLQEAAKLATIAGVEQFEVLKQVSAKNNFGFGLSMEFKDQQAYDHYNNHPQHTAFVQNIWIPQVEDFMEIDYKPFSV